LVSWLPATDLRNDGAGSPQIAWRASSPVGAGACMTEGRLRLTISANTSRVATRIRGLAFLDGRLRRRGRIAPSRDFLSTVARAELVTMA
jgi:hypothetical protein